MELQGNLKKILKKGVIKNELDFQRAAFIDRQLRLLVKEFPALAEDRKQLRALLAAYEEKHWVKAAVTDQLVQESDRALAIAEEENDFLLKRKHAIKNRLKELGLTQKDLAVILNHTSASYVSELINGVNPFTLTDIIVMHKLLNIPMDELVPTTLTMQVINRVISAISGLNQSKLKCNVNDLVLAVSK